MRERGTNQRQAKMMAVRQRLRPRRHLGIGFEIMPCMAAVVVSEPPAFGVGSFVDDHGGRRQVVFHNHCGFGRQDAVQSDYVAGKAEQPKSASKGSMTIGKLG